MPEAPQIRGSQVKENVASLSLLGSDLEAKIRDRLSPATLRRVEESTRLDWLPLEMDLELTETVSTVAGRDAFLRWSRTTMGNSLQGTFLGPLVDGAVAIFGLQPTGILKVATRGWNLIFRGCGTLRYRSDARGECELHNHSAAKIMADNKLYLDGIAASLCAIFDVCRVTGVAEATRPETDRIVFRAEWRPRGREAEQSWPR